MRIEDIVTLAKAGFNAEQIAKMAAITVDPEPAKDPEPAMELEPAKDPSINDNFDKIMQQFSALRSDMQQTNIRMSEQPARPAETVDTILASIINPPVREGETNGR